MSTRRTVGPRDSRDVLSKQVSTNQPNSYRLVSVEEEVKKKELSRACEPNEGTKRKEAKQHDNSTAANERKVRERGHNMGKGGEKVAVTPRYPRTLQGQCGRGSIERYTFLRLGVSQPPGDVGMKPMLTEDRTGPHEGLRLQIHCFRGCRSESWTNRVVVVCMETMMFVDARRGWLAFWSHQSESNPLVS